jgi:hypothetical protein
MGDSWIWEGININITFRFNGAADELRTRNPQLGRLILYQLSYCRVPLFLVAQLSDKSNPKK